MNPERIEFDLTFFNRLFPFHFIINRNMTISSCGESLKKIQPFLIGEYFLTKFRVKRPGISIHDFSDLRSLQGQTVILEILNEHNHIIHLRGQLDLIEREQSYLFTGSPWFNSIDELTSSHLTLSDFALHDPMIDLLHLLKTQEMTLDEVKILLKKVKSQKDKLIASELNYRNIVEMASDIIFKINLDGNFTFVNDVTERITGYSRQELLGMNYKDLIHKDYLNQTIAFYSKQILENIPSTYYEFPMITKNGKELWIGQSAQYPQSITAPIELTCLAIDINERKQAENNLKIQEEKYRNILTNMNLGLLEVDLDDRIIWANKSFSAISGYTLEELVTKKANNLLLDEEGKRYLAMKMDQRRLGHSDTYSIPIRNKNGEERWWVISGAPSYNDRGELVGSIGVHLDVTDQKKLETELIEAKKKAEDSSKAKELFLSTMSHEIRTPLNAIVGLSDLMRMDKDSINESNLQILNFSSRNLHSLISDILDLAKIDAGKIELLHNPFNFIATVNGICQTFIPTCQDKNIALQVEIDPKIPQTVVGDELRLSQILNNLIGNAVKFTHKGEVKLCIDCVHRKKDQASLVFRVSDTGIGISKKNLKTIFNAFEQGEKEIVRQFGGTGLGLSITRKLIQLHKSEIFVQSELKKGSEFRFQLDYKIPEAHIESANASISDTPTPIAQLRGRHVLLVDDNPINQTVAKSYLQYWQLDIDMANHGEEALHMMESKDYDLILLDLFMPVMDGFETMKRIRKVHRWKKLPVIALTASAEISILSKIEKLGANLCLTKPINPKELFHGLVELLDPSIEPLTYKKADEPTQVDKPKTLIHLSKIKEASLGSDAFVRDMVALLRVEIPKLMRQAEHYLLENELLTFSSTIHKLKSNLLLLGMDHLKNDLRYLEEHSKKENHNDVFIPVFNRLKATWEGAGKELDSLMNV